MAPTLVLTAVAQDQTGARLDFVLGADRKVQDAFARLTGTAAALKTARLCPNQAIALPAEVLTELEVDGPEARTARVSHRSYRRAVPAVRLGLDDERLIALLTLQDRTLDGAHLALRWQ